MCAQHNNGGVAADADGLRKEAEEFAALAMKEGKGKTGDTLSSIWKKAWGEMSVAAGMIRNAAPSRSRIMFLRPSGKPTWNGRAEEVSGTKGFICEMI